jgi:hypothetical protein
MVQIMKTLWLKIPDGIRRVINTAWQAAIGAVAAFLITPHSTVDTKVLLGIVYAAVLAAVKAAIVTATTSSST